MFQPKVKAEGIDPISRPVGSSTQRARPEEISATPTTKSWRPYWPSRDPLNHMSSPVSSRMPYAFLERVKHCKVCTYPRMELSEDMQDSSSMCINVQYGTYEAKANSTE